MRKILPFWIIVIVLIAIPAVINAQQDRKSIKDEKLPVSVGMIFGREGSGLQTSLHIRDGSKRPILFVGFEICEKSQTGIVVGTEIPKFLDNGENFSIRLPICLEWQNRQKFITSHNRLIDQTIQEQNRMILTCGIGPQLQLGRFSFWFRFSGGTSFYPSNHPEQNDWRWYWGGNGIFSFWF